MGGTRQKWGVHCVGTQQRPYRMVEFADGRVLEGLREKSSISSIAYWVKRLWPATMQGNSFELVGAPTDACE